MHEPFVSEGDGSWTISVRPELEGATLLVLSAAPIAASLGVFMGLGLTLVGAPNGVIPVVAFVAATVVVWRAQLVSVKAVGEEIHVRNLFRSQTLHRRDVRQLSIASFLGGCPHLPVVVIVTGAATAHRTVKLHATARLSKRSWQNVTTMLESLAPKDERASW